MTLILTCLTQDFVIQASDRRLIFAFGPNAGQIIDDERNKAVVYAGVATIAYTGLADLGAEGYTDYWIVDTLAKAVKKNPNVSSVIDSLGEAAAPIFFEIARTNPRVPLNHAFIAAGWKKHARTAPFHAYIAAISNCLNDDWTWQRNSENAFTRRIRELGSDEDLHWFAAGARLLESERAALDRQLRRAVRKRKGLDRIAHLLVAAIRTVNERQHVKTVGRSVLVVSVARPGPQLATGVATAVNRKLIESGVSSVYFPGNSLTAAMYQPYLVSASGTAMRDGQVFSVVPFKRSMDVPWLKGAVILCPYIVETSPPLPQAARDHPNVLWSSYAEIDSQGRDDLPRPIIVIIDPATPNLESILADSRLFVLARPLSDEERRLVEATPDVDELPPGLDASWAALDPWLKKLGTYLVECGISKGAVSDFIDTMRGRQRGWVVLYLREWFQRLQPPRKP